ncbi:hypothetical protein FHR81_004954 [Actinoalloteichus hoggarensis]|uniref:hypothetical protein n=1 Tax=Actinoalloteichus hoggarensis TaxID=1470176 RepID=UPI0012FD3806|nr:hypothetical protein [Actinoalloteichus hoggarensis]MBB5923881.1 hypothetical protein [Actinoalloteichus hoggarensis]
MRRFEAVTGPRPPVGAGRRTRRLVADLGPRREAMRVWTDPDAPVSLPASLDGVTLR